MKKKDEKDVKMKKVLKMKSNVVKELEKVLKEVKSLKKDFEKDKI